MSFTIQSTTEIVIHIDTEGLKSLQSTNPSSHVSQFIPSIRESLQGILAEYFIVKLLPTKENQILCLGRAKPFEIGSTVTTSGDFHSQTNWNLNFIAPADGWYAVKSGCAPSVYHGWSNAVSSGLAAANKLFILHDNGTYRASLGSFVDLDKVSNDGGDEEDTEETSLLKEATEAYLKLSLNYLSSSPRMNNSWLVPSEPAWLASRIWILNYGSPGLIEALDPQDRTEYCHQQREIMKIILQNAKLGPNLHAQDGVAIVKQLQQLFAGRLVNPDLQKYLELWQNSLNLDPSQESDDNGEEGGDEETDELKFSQTGSRVLPKRKARPTSFAPYFQRAPMVQSPSQTPPPKRRGCPKKAIQSVTDAPAPAASISDEENLLHQALRDCDMHQFYNCLAGAGFDDDKNLHQNASLTRELCELFTEYVHLADDNGIPATQLETINVINALQAVRSRPSI
ncbi:hypothetical protein C8J56DRAFT_1038936 [Mycena floridula]|nr:hypothetical protein C8J56DRAFT_1038936 [Mycena floridula]